MITVLLVISTVPGHADRGGHGYKGYGHGGHGHQRAWASRAAGLHQPTPRRPLRSLLEAILGALSARGDGAASPGLCRTLAAPAPVLVLLRRRASLLPVW